ncbi:hypothetical protein HYT18_03295 [Candidatus Microgenomates bacterium]|nr:hypothetical protein [Candidatus Microgenomates bacterium]
MALNLIGKKVHIAVMLFMVIAAVLYIGSSSKNTETPLVNQALVAKFDYLSKNGNSSCSQSFQTSIPAMSDNARLQGSCCSPMSMHRYQEQVEGLKKYKDIPDIPSDPYDIEAGLAKKLLSYYDLQLTPQQQKAYDYAMQNSQEKGPCCCKCWRWYVYGGLGKLLIREKGFTGQQVTEVWNLSDGCGGEGDHVSHNVS